MPTYVYACTNAKCSIEYFDAIRRVSDMDFAECPECGNICERDAARSMYPVGIIYKGSGFHSTDYRGK